MKSTYTLVLFAALAAGGVHAACTNPSSPSNIPRGKSATQEEMLAGQKAVKEYDAKVNDYVACLQSEADAKLAKIDASDADQKKKDKQKKDLNDAVVKKQNAAIDIDKKVAERFNEQLRIYKAKSEPASGNKG